MPGRIGVFEGGPHAVLIEVRLAPGTQPSFEVAWPPSLRDALNLRRTV